MDWTLLGIALCIGVIGGFLILLWVLWDEVIDFWD